MKKTKVGCAILSTNVNAPDDVKAVSIGSIANVAPRLMVFGPTEPAKYDGLRWIKGDASYTIKNAIANYMREFRGYEVVLMCNPTLEFNKEGMDSLLKFLDAQKMDMSWATYSGTGHDPDLFIFSSHILAHIVNDIPDKMLFTDNWQAWMNDWCKKMLRHRYFDGNEYKISSVIVPPQKQVEPEVSKKKVAKR